MAALQAYLSSAAAIRTLPYDPSTDEYGPVQILFVARDAAGNASPAQTQSVFISVTSDACEAGELLCESGACSIGGLCIDPALAALFGGAETAAPVSTYTPPVDTTPPVITMQGEPPGHVRAVSAGTGEVILETAVAVAAVYVDAGAAAFDDTDGDLTASVAATGVAWVDTSAPTEPSVPFVVKYAVSDASGNAAARRSRRVSVECPEGRKLCAGDGGGYFCSISSDVCVQPRGSVPTAPPPEPVVTLVGAAVVEVNQGDSYGACGKQTPVSTPCDRGATAYSSVEGDVTVLVEACVQGFAFAEFGLQGCGFDTDVSGAVELEFFVMHGPVKVAVARTLWVLPTCAPGEALCGDRSCSTDGVCPPGAPVRVPAVNEAPVITMHAVASETENGEVLVPRGWLYSACSPDSLPNALQPCETGKLLRSAHPRACYSPPEVGVHASSFASMKSPLEVCIAAWACL